MSRYETESREDTLISPERNPETRSSGLNQRASASSAPRWIAGSSATAVKPSMIDAGNGHGCEEW